MGHDYYHKKEAGFRSLLTVIKNHHFECHYV